MGVLNVWVLNSRHPDVVWMMAGDLKKIMGVLNVGVGLNLNRG